MTDIDLEILLSKEVREAIERNIERDPAKVALDRGVPHAAMVATQVKYLQRARRKLPSLYAKRCIIPPRALEQSSSEESAERKMLSGDTVLDLTCGLGIDAMALSKRFRRVVALERDAVLADVVRANLRLLGIDNVEVVTASSEEYVATTTEHFDWIFADPDRRSDTGRKMVCMEDCSPNIIALMPRLRKISDRQAIKLSPMFDCEEAFRLLSPSTVEVVSIAGECKELNIYTQSERDMLRIAIVGRGEWLFEPSAMHAEPTRSTFDPSAYRYMIIPDVALQKARVAIAALLQSASIWSNNGYAFATELPMEPIPGRVYAIESIDRYRPKELKRQLKGVGVELLKRDTSLAVEAVRRQLGLRAGSERLLALTTIESENWIIALKSI